MPLLMCRNLNNPFEVFIEPWIRHCKNPRHIKARAERLAAAAFARSRFRHALGVENLDLAMPIASQGSSDNPKSADSHSRPCKVTGMDPMEVELIMDKEVWPVPEPAVSAKPSMQVEPTVPVRLGSPLVHDHTGQSRQADPSSSNDPIVASPEITSNELASHSLGNGLPRDTWQVRCIT